MPSHEDTLLTDLCTICHIHPPKYRCPRCSARTCSLPCTKRHKLWSQCTGVRDPGAYLKRSELVTPKAIDQDFNFISSVERNIERAGVDAEARGVRLRTGKQNGGQEKGAAALAKALERAQVMVDRAPRGMAKSKGNRTRWLHKSKQIAWSVEWRTTEGGEVQHECLESGTLTDLYDGFLRSKEPRTKKRKVTHGGSRTSQVEGAEESTVLQGSVHEARDSDGGHQKDSERPLATLDEDAEQIFEAQTTPDLGDKPQESLPSDPKAPLKRPSPSSVQHITRKFYLHRPHTPSSQPTVLIPLSASETLTSALQGKVVLEFPTVFVLTETPDELPRAYMTEDTYLGGQRKEDLVLKRDRVDEREGEGSEDGELGDVVLKDIDEKKVLEVLRKDIGIGVG